MEDRTRYIAERIYPVTEARFELQEDGCGRVVSVPQLCYGDVSGSNRCITTNMSHLAEKTRFQAETGIALSGRLIPIGTLPLSGLAKR